MRRIEVVVISSAVTFGAMLLAVSGARADQQQIGPGTGLQSSVVVDTGADGLCQTTAQGDDVQFAAVGQGSPFQNEVRCGANLVADTLAIGDDTQLVAVGAACKNASQVIIDSGADGLASSTAASDDVQLIPPGTVPAHAPCVIAGANGVGDTPDPVGGDDVRKLAVGTAQANTAVVLCGPNGKSDTPANNVNALGDDVQVVPVGNSCMPDDVVVDSGGNGIADTRAEGSDLVMKVARSTKISIGFGHTTASKTINLFTSNEEFNGPASRLYKLVVSNGTCPKGTVNQVDADTSTPGLQATATIARGSRIKGSFVATLRLQDITSFSSDVPFRCEVAAEARIADDPNLGSEPDDGANPENNASPVDIEGSDRNDL
ncbi:MAG TPA: hypothetical protein VGK30_16155 [Candidatus Binatia bacterium]|jgi:hypothetical protein